MHRTEGADIAVTPHLDLSHKWQNRLLLIVSCIFYAAWDWRFLALLFVPITVDYFCGLKIYESNNENIKKRFLLLSLLVNFSILGFFKYFNFFAANFTGLLSHFGLSVHLRTLNILLPLGISFYTFKTISYTIDVYTEKVKPTRSYFDYALFVSFFPVILAGPIMKAGDLLRQISSPRKLKLKWFYEGSYLIFWGVFQKFFVADNLAAMADKVFNSPPPYNGAGVIVAVYAFAFQIYCDFAGYSNIARGVGRCMGFDIMVNFNLPYFATNPQDFWNRWHISLSNWLRDYLYNPISFSKRRWGIWGVVFALMTTFLICGLWHGAAWTFVAWGAYWGVLLILYAFLKPFLAKIPKPKNRMLDKIWLLARIFLFFNVVCIGWILFRANSFGQALDLFNGLVSNFSANVEFIKNALQIAFFTALLVIIEIFEYYKADSEIVIKWPYGIRYVLYGVIIYLLFFYGSTTQAFIYSQF